jgi:hypothetical protein
MGDQQPIGDLGGLLCWSLILGLGHPKSVTDHIHRRAALHMRHFAGCLDSGWQGSPRTHFGRPVSCSSSPARRLEHSRGPSLSFPVERLQSSVPRIPSGCIAVSAAERCSRHYSASRPSSLWALPRLCSGSRPERSRRSLNARFCKVAPTSPGPFVIASKAGPAFGRQNQRAKSRLPDERSEPAKARPSHLCDRSHLPIFRSARVLVSHNFHPSHPHPSTFS